MVTPRSLRPVADVCPYALETEHPQVSSLQRLNLQHIAYSMELEATNATVYAYGNLRKRSLEKTGKWAAFHSLAMCFTVVDVSARLSSREPNSPPPVGPLSIAKAPVMRSIFG
jgi:hypothetical protein